MRNLLLILLFCGLIGCTFSKNSGSNDTTYSLDSVNPRTSWHL